MFQRVTFDTQRIGGSIQDEDEIQYPRPLLYTFFYLSYKQEHLLMSLKNVDANSLQSRKARKSNIFSLKFYLFNFWRNEYCLM